MVSNDLKYKHIFMFPEKNSVHQTSSYAVAILACRPVSVHLLSSLMGPLISPADSLTTFAAVMMIYIKNSAGKMMPI